MNWYRRWKERRRWEKWAKQYLDATLRAIEERETQNP